MSSPNEQRSNTSFGSYHNWDNQYKNKDRLLVRCRCQGHVHPNCDYPHAHHFKGNYYFSEQIEALDRNKDIVSKQYLENLRNQENERIRKLKEYQDHKLPQLNSLNKGQMGHNESQLKSQTDLYDEFEKSMKNFNQLNYSSYKDQQGNLIGGIQRDATAITDKSTFDKRNNKDYEDYMEKHKEYSDYNLQLTRNKKKSNEKQFEIDKLHEGNVILKRNFFNEYDSNLKSLENEKRQLYKQSLDDQRMFQVRSKLANERYTIESAMMNPQNFHYGTNYLDRTFLNQNQFVEVNPCKHCYFMLITL